MHQNKNPQQSPWQRRRQQRRQQDDQLAIERKQALDASAPRLRNLFIFVQVFLLYVVVSIFGVDDRDLLDPNSTVKVPLLNIGLPTFYFFLLAPVLIALLHINLLLHHQAYQDKLRHWRDGAPKAQLDQLAPNFFDIAFLAQDRWQRQLVRASLWFLLYFWPPAALCLALFWFADYQNPWITLEHFALLIISYGASVYFSWRRDHARQELRTLLLWALTLLLGLILLTGSYLAVSFWAFDHPNPLLTLAYIALLIIGGGISVHLPWSKICANNELQNLSRWLQGLLLSALPLVGIYLTALVISLTWVSYKHSDPWFKSNLLYQPNIDAPSFIYQDLDASTIDLASAYETNVTDAELIKNYSQPLELNGRSLRYANLASSFLPRVRLTDADLAGANLIQASLQGAELGEAQLQGAYLWRARLQGAYLWQAQLQGAYLRAAQLQGGTLWQAQLQGAFLRRAQLQGAYLRKAQLQGAYLWQAQLQGASLWQAQLQGADLEEAQLQGADLSAAQLQGAFLLGAQLQGADLEEAQFQGANLRKAQLQGATLWLAQLQGADLGLAQLQGADLSEAQLQGTWSNPSTVSDLNWTNYSRANLLLLKGLDSDLSNVNKHALSTEAATAIIAELEEVKLLDSLPDWRARSIDEAITRIRVGINQNWTLKDSGAITGELTQEMIDEILEQWDD